MPKRVLAPRIKRVYDAPAESDGMRILVDRLWPRGLTKEAARIDLWLKELAPTNELRRWYGHAPERWEEFQARYFTELDGNPQAVRQLRAALRTGNATLLFSAKAATQNNAIALVNYLNQRKTT